MLQKCALTFGNRTFVTHAMATESRPQFLVENVPMAMSLGCEKEHERASSNAAATGPVK